MKWIELRFFCRIRINGVGVFDVLRHDTSHGNPRAHMQQYQQDDMAALGRVSSAILSSMRCVTIRNVSGGSCSGVQLVDFMSP